jgi:hypothetical protein
MDFDKRWSPLRHLYPWGRTVERIIGTLAIPRLDGPVMYVASDYGGEHGASLYETFSVLYLDVEASSEWDRGRRAVRQQFLSDGRRMAFKSLNDGRRQDALVPFLDAANHIVGISLTLAVRKSIQHLCSDEEFFAYTKQRLTLDTGWKYHSFERMLRIINLVTMLYGGLSKQGQSIYWISDQDSLFANERRSQDLKKILDRWSSHYVTHSLGELGVGTTTIDEGDRIDEDLNAIPDLMAGAVAEVVTALAQAYGGSVPVKLAVPFDKALTPKADLIYSWITDNQYELQRAVILVEKSEPRGFSVSKLECSA